MSDTIFGGTTATPIPISTIDQAYNPESENAQSGKAVAEALKPKEYELINSITVAPDTDGSLPSSVAFSTDSEGNPFALYNFYILIRGKTTATPANVDIKFINRYGTMKRLIQNASVGFNNSAFRRTVFRFFKLSNGYTTFSIDNSCVDANTSYYNPQIGVARAAYLQPNSTEIIATEKFDNLYVEISNDTWAEGCTFELWGVRE